LGNGFSFAPFLASVALQLEMPFSSAPRGVCVATPGLEWGEMESRLFNSVIGHSSGLIPFWRAECSESFYSCLKDSMTDGNGSRHQSVDYLVTVHFKW
jgi:hypothetical protein